MIAFPSTTTSYQDLYKKIEKKIKLCTGMDDSHPLGTLKVQYRDEGGDLVWLNCDEDMAFAFEAFQGRSEKVMAIYVGV